MNLLEHGGRKFPQGAVLAASAGLGWRGVAAEVRSHPAGDLPPFRSSQIEITLALEGVREAVVGRNGDGRRQETPVEPGVLWICPAGVSESEIRITRPLSRVLHVYLPTESLNRWPSSAGSSPGNAVLYLAGVRDDLLRHIGLSLHAEMRSPSAGGALLAESLGMALAARLLQSYASGQRPGLSATRHALDDLRLRRVVDYMVEHLDQPIGLADLAGVACVSTFHFSRRFRAKTGLPPHRYLAELRIERAKTLLLRGELSLAEVALACGFSDQSNFGRAFRKACGSTPAAFQTAGAR